MQSHTHTKILFLKTRYFWKLLQNIFPKLWQRELHTHTHTHTHTGGQGKEKKVPHPALLPKKNKERIREGSVLILLS